MNNFNKLNRKEKIKIIKHAGNLGDLLFSCAQNKDINTIKSLKEYRNELLYSLNRCYYKSINYCIDNKDFETLHALLDLLIIKSEERFDNNLIKENINLDSGVSFSLKIEVELFKNNLNNEKIKDFILEYADINDIFETIVSLKDIILIERLFDRINFNDENHENLLYICNSDFDFSDFIKKLNIEENAASFIYIKNQIFVYENNKEYTPNIKNSDAIFNKIKNKENIIKMADKIEQELKNFSFFYKQDNSIYQKIKENIYDLILKEKLEKDLSSEMEIKSNKNKRKI